MYARYTEYLRDIMLNEATKPFLDKALSTYPLYEAKKTVDLIPTREQLNTKILNHFKYREIGFETVGRFLDELEITMNEIMPYYNERFKTIEVMAEIENPFDSVDMVETFEQETSQSSQSTGTTSQSGTNSQTMSTEGENSSTAKTTSDTATNTKQLSSDTPQDEISVGTKDIDGVGYASNAEWNEALSDSSQDTTTSESSSSETSSEGSNSSEGSSSGTSESSGKIKHTLTRKGAQGVTTFGHDMIEFRDSIIDVMNEIITDQRLNELFMMVY